MRWASRYSIRVLVVLGAAVAAALVPHARSPWASAQDVPAADTPVAAREAAILEALSAVKPIELSGVTLEEFIAMLEDDFGIEVELNVAELEEAGISSDIELSKNLRGVQLRSALALILRPLGLDWTVHHDVLYITTKEDIDNQEIVRVYSVADLFTLEGDQAFTEETLIEVITSTIEPHAWDEVGGPGSIRSVPEQLAIRQTFRNHEKIARLLADLRTAQQGQSPSSQESAATAQVREALVQVRPVEWLGVNLEEVAAQLEEDFNIDVELDRTALEEAGIGIDTEFSRTLREVPLASALGLALDPLGLDWIVSDEVLFITTKEEVDTRLDTRVYLVNNVLHSMDHDELIDTIAATVEPHTWDEVGGPGSIKAAPNALVIAQTDKTHALVADLMARLRQDVAAAGPRDDRQVLVSYAVGFADIDDVADAVQRFIAPESWANGGTLAVIHAQANAADARQVAAPAATAGANTPPPAQVPVEGQPIADPSGFTTPAPPPAQEAAPLDARTFVGGWLMIRQTRAVHRQIEELLRSLQPEGTAADGGGGGGGFGGGGGGGGFF